MKTPARLAATAVAFIACAACSNTPVSVHDATLRSALSSWETHIEKITGGSEFRATIDTDLTTSDLGLGTALGMCRQIEATAIEDLMVVVIKSTGGNELATCSPAEQ
ncbi:hypothetical protein [Cellulomonas uda]|uniref:DUF732 domain-containing protein n=1 Tax=Cellulomonas uda TaxID=1714 RepID=A0A4Y3KBH3_CELUD|nr:hypothetical protein [Cellulomonas uda]NII67572.1 3-dehydroquinate dehydratase [Cellulomonas uda]GEA81347.1 hypothetical protein CUD01_17910 [Cellulomonas uda]